jgi:Anti-repressor SinI
MKTVDYYEWFMLLKEAKESGINKNEIKSFFRKQSIKKGNEIKTEYKKEGAHNIE